jgi:hypothetical protein
VVLVVILALACAFALQTQPAAVDRAADALATGWVLTGASGDGIAGFITRRSWSPSGRIGVHSHIVLPRR